MMGEARGASSPQQRHAAAAPPHRASLFLLGAPGSRSCLRLRQRLGLEPMARARLGGIKRPSLHPAPAHSRHGSPCRVPSTSHAQTDGNQCVLLHCTQRSWRWTHTPRHTLLLYCRSGSGSE